MADSSLYIHCQVILGCLLQTVHLHYQVIFGCLWQTFPFILASHTWLSVADSSNSIIKSYSVVYGNKSVTQPSLIGLSIPDSPCYTVSRTRFSIADSSWLPLDILSFPLQTVSFTMSSHTRRSTVDSSPYTVQSHSVVFCRQTFILCQSHASLSSEDSPCFTVKS